MNATLTAEQVDTFKVLSDDSATIGGVTFTAGPGIVVYRYDHDETFGRGVLLQFANGFELSVMWGSSNYCENRDGGARSCCGPTPDFDRDVSVDAEIALFRTDGRRIVGDVTGWVSTAQVLALVPHLIGLAPNATAFPNPMKVLT